MIEGLQIARFDLEVSVTLEYSPTLIFHPVAHTVKGINSVSRMRKTIEKH